MATNKKAPHKAAKKQIPLIVNPTTDASFNLIQCQLAASALMQRVLVKVQTSNVAIKLIPIYSRVIMQLQDVILKHQEFLMKVDLLNALPKDIQGLQARQQMEKLSDAELLKKLFEAQSVLTIDNQSLVNSLEETDKVEKRPEEE